MICSNCGSPRTRYVKTVNKQSQSFSNEFLLQKDCDALDIYRCMTCGSTFNTGKNI